jgi:hypothetical protein
MLLQMPRYNFVSRSALGRAPPPDSDVKQGLRKIAHNPPPPASVLRGTPSIQRDGRPES